MINDYNYTHKSKAYIKTPILAILVSVLLIGPQSVWALRSDKEKPIQIEANQVDIDDKNGISTYSGSVRLTQGSMRLLAQKIIVYSDDRKLSRVVATGNPALFSQRPDDSPGDVEAQAMKVDYSALDGVLTLTNQAKLAQGGNEFQGNRIEYETHNHIVRAMANEAGDQRVKVVIQPESLNEKKK